MASFTKLRSGAWGIRVEGTRPADGSSVNVVKKDGSATTVVVARVIWSDDGGTLHLAAIEEKKRGGYRRTNGPIEVRTSGGTFTQNARGRCEDAPCCGCCTF
jgi:hypothetical protein